MVFLGASAHLHPTKSNVGHSRKDWDGWLAHCHADLHDDEILTLSRVTWPPDKTKISSGVSQSHMGDKSIEIVQYSQIPISWNGVIGSKFLSNFFPTCRGVEYLFCWVSLTSADMQLVDVVNTSKE